MRAKGIRGLGIKKEAWVELARANAAGLNQAVVMDLVEGSIKLVCPGNI